MSEDGSKGPPSGRSRVARVDVKRVTPDQLLLSDAFLKGCPVVKALGPDAATELFRTGSARRYPDKARVCAAEDAPTTVFMVVRGEVRLQTAKGAECGVARRGEFFGEVGPDGAHRSASGYADGEADVIELPAAAMANALLSSDAFAELMESLKAGRSKASSEQDDFLNRW